MSSPRRNKPLSLVKQAVDRLLGMFCPGRSKHADKKHNNGKPRKDVIYSCSTLKTYIAVACTFLHWAKAIYGIRWLEEGLPYVGEYLTQQIAQGLSPYTIARNRSALAKLYQVPSRSLLAKLPPCTRASVKRYDTVTTEQLEAFACGHPDIYIVACGTGARVHELRLTRPEHYTFWAGRGWVHIKGKGGRHRKAEILPEYMERVREIVDRARAEGREKLFSSIPQSAPIHYLRHGYAQALYRQYARDIRQLARTEKYVCRAEMTGIVLDKAAMKQVTRSLGHNRLGVVTRYIKPLPLLYDGQMHVLAA